jgi:hypothetical protein
MGKHSVHRFTSGKYQQPGGAHVQTVHGKRIREFMLHPARQAIHFIQPAPRHRK